MREQLTSLRGIDSVLAVLSELRSSDMSTEEFSDFLFCDDIIVAKNAAWVLTHTSPEEIATIEQRKDELINLAMTTHDTSLRRLLLTLLERMTYDADSIRTDFLDFCIDGMQSLSEPPGVQSLCMKLAYKQCRLYDELLDELKVTLENMQIQYYKPAVHYVWRTVLKKKSR